MTPRIVTPERAKEIEERLGRATPGDWRSDGLGVLVENRGIIAFCATPQNGGVFEVADNVRIIAHAPEDLRDLLHTLAVEREESARLRGLFTEDNRTMRVIHVNEIEDADVDGYFISEDALAGASARIGEEWCPLPKVDALAKWLERRMTCDYGQGNSFEQDAGALIDWLRVVPESAALAPGKGE